MRLSKGMLTVTAQMKFTLLPETLKYERQHIAKYYANNAHEWQIINLHIL